MKMTLTNYEISVLYQALFPTRSVKGLTIREASHQLSTEVSALAVFNALKKIQAPKEPAQ
jgi:hypothetical protein